MEPEKLKESQYITDSNSKDLNLSGSICNFAIMDNNRNRKKKYSHQHNIPGAGKG